VINNNGTISKYYWSQSEGPPVILNYAETATPSFSDPNVSNDTLLKFSLSVKDSKNVSGNIDDINIFVKPKISSDSNVISSTPTAIIKPMSILIEKIQTGKSQSLIITVKDSKTYQPIEGVFLSGNLNVEFFSGITDSNGEFVKVIPQELLQSASTLEVAVTATADGYKTNKVNTTFVLSTTSTSSVTNCDNIDDKETKDMTSKVAKDVQKQLSKQGINIPLPFCQRDQ